jgi:hypothetical protein
MTSTILSFVRVRPFTEDEKKLGYSELDGLQLNSSDPDDRNAKPFSTPSSTIDGFTGVLGIETSNFEVFNRCLEPHMSTVLNGGSVSFFTYGYTGGGKTHTVVGYNGERGVYFVAAEYILNQLEHLHAAHPPDDTGLQELFLRATACEIYLDKVYDILGPTKLECDLRVDENNELQIISRTPSREYIDGIDCTSSGPHATIVTRTDGLRSVLLTNADGLQEIAQSCVQQRAFGTSTEHTQSSRSHAILKLEIVNSELLHLLALYEDAKALLPAAKNAAENFELSALSQLFQGAPHVNMKRVLRIHDPNHSPIAFTTTQSTGKEQQWLLSIDKNEWEVIITPTATPATVSSGNETEATGIGGSNTLQCFCLKGLESAGAKTKSEWALFLGAVNGEFCDLHQEMKPGALIHRYVLTKTLYENSGDDDDEDNNWDSMYAKCVIQQRILRERVNEIERNIQHTRDAITHMKAIAHPALCGSILFADLAGADYDHRVGMGQKESTAINKSLLALKECLRAVSGGTRPKFRDSKLTRVLEDAIAPSLERSNRRNLTSTSVMLINVSPSAHLDRMTMNSLRYGQMFVVEEKKRKNKYKK